MNVCPINAFKTSDGQIFEDEKKALNHQVFLNFSSRYADDPLYYDVEEVIPAEEALRWLQWNKKLILEVLNQ